MSSVYTHHRERGSALDLHSCQSLAASARSYDPHSNQDGLSFTHLAPPVHISPFRSTPDKCGTPSVPLLGDPPRLEGLSISIPVSPGASSNSDRSPRPENHPGISHSRHPSLLPSNPRFDRLAISAEDYIELLLYEISELRADLNARDLVIARLSSNNHNHSAYTDRHRANSSAAACSPQRSPVAMSLDPNSLHKRRERSVSSASNASALSVSPSPHPVPSRSELRSLATLHRNHSTASSPQSAPDPSARSVAGSPKLNKSRASATLDSSCSGPSIPGAQPALPSESTNSVLRTASNPTVMVLQSFSPHAEHSPASLYEDSPARGERPQSAISHFDFPGPQDMPSYFDGNHGGLANAGDRGDSLASPASLDSASYTSGRIGEPALSGTMARSPMASRANASTPVLSRPYLTDAAIISPSPNATIDLAQSFTSEPRSTGPSLSTPNLSLFGSTENLSRAKPSVQTPGSSFSVRMPTEADASLLIKPEEFNTISVNVASTITAPTSSSTIGAPRRSDEPTCTIAINDRQSMKEMWRVRKTYAQLQEFSVDTRYIVEYFKLPELPDRSLFNSSTPAKMDQRMSQLQAYFSAIFAMPHIPQLVLYKVCRFLSLDFVNPLDDYKSGALYEGFLTRKYKSLVSSWKTKWCQVDGPLLEIYDSPGGQLVEQIQLNGCQIGKQADGPIAEDKGFRNAFIIVEPSKAGRSPNKHVFCAETSAARDEWIAALAVQTGDEDLADVVTVNSMDLSTFSPYLGSSTEDLSRRSAFLPASNTGPYNPLSTEEIPQMLKDLKKSRKRSYFPFRSAVKSAEPDADASFESGVSILDSIAPSSLVSVLGLEEDAPRSVFSRSIGEARGLSAQPLYGHQVPSILFRCIDYLTQVGAVHEEGIFRLSGLASTIRQLKIEFDTHFDIDLFEHPLSPDMHTVAGLLKLYLRELKQPIIGPTVSRRLTDIIQSHDKTQLPGRLAFEFKQLITTPGNMDAADYDATFAVCKFLTIVLAQQLHNLMNLRNLCIVFVPTLNVPIEGLSMLLQDFSFIFENGTLIADSDRAVVDVHIPVF